MGVVTSVSEVTLANELSFTVVWGGPDGEARVPLMEAANCRLESGLPVRRFASYRGQRHFPGWYWSASSLSHVPFESWLERNHALLLDFDPKVTCIAAQPFWLLWTDPSTGAQRSHAPDFFARTVDHDGLVVDCRPVECIDGQAAAQFAAMRMACEQAGWDYRVAGAIEVTRMSNLRWLAGYRHPRHGANETVSARVRAAFEIPAPLFAQASYVGDPITVLPVVYHLLWQGILAADLSMPLSDHTVVSGGWKRP